MGQQQITRAKISGEVMGWSTRPIRSQSVHCGPVHAGARQHALLVSTSCFAHKEGNDRQDGSQSSVLFKPRLTLTEELPLHRSEGPGPQSECCLHNWDKHSGVLQLVGLIHDIIADKAEKHDPNVALLLALAGSSGGWDQGLDN